jgi:small subunit ribosomal protein S6
MSNKYELTIVLDTRGKEESIDKILGQIGKEIESEGGRLQQIDQLGRKKFAYSPRKVDEGFFANFHFEAEPAAIEKVRSRLKLNHDVFLQHLLKKTA